MSCSSDECEYELVTWSRDQTLRLWSLKADLLQACGHELAHGANGADTDHAASPTTDGTQLTQLQSAPTPTPVCAGRRSGPGRPGGCLCRQLPRQTEPHDYISFSTTA